ncbi:FAD-dependent monooxygenase [Streptomyces stelliscabiei]
MRTKVGFIGAGPAGSSCARLLHRADIDCVVLESRTRAHVGAAAGDAVGRRRAGAGHRPTRCAPCGAAARLETEGVVQHGIELRFDRERHRLDLPALTGRPYRHDLSPGGESSTTSSPSNSRTGHRCCSRRRRSASRARSASARWCTSSTTGTRRNLSCEWVVGCDGFHGISRHVFPAAARRVYEHEHPYSWLGVSPKSRPPREESIYARGDPRASPCTACAQRSVSRFCLQSPSGTDPADWPDERVWDELAARFAIDADWTLERGPVTAKSVTPMRSHVHEPMRHGRLLLAGGAAHTVAPTGTEGLNLGVYEVCVLARALVELYTHGTAQLLDRTRRCASTGSGGRPASRTT